MSESATPATGIDAVYSADYAQARRRFLAAGQGGRVQTPPAQLQGFETLDWLSQEGERLYIDIAWLGAARPRRVVLHSCGVHGIEGFAGSAIQCRLLQVPPPLRAHEALVLVHVLNPWGMARLRRTNEHNVDLNRNCQPDAAAYTGCHPLYHRLDPLLNPASPPARDGFYLRALWALLRHGPARVRQAVAGGQYEYARGLFYGGRMLEPGLAVYRDWLQRRLTGVERVDAIDVHTGLGPWARASVFVETELSVQSWREAGYATEGGLMGCLPAWLPNQAVYAVVQEFGTYPGLRVMHALREENRRYFHGATSDAAPARENLRLCEMLYPASPAWRSAVLHRGVGLVQRWCAGGVA